MTYRSLLLALLIFFVSPIFAGNPPDLHVAPYLQHVTPNGVTVRWETTEPVIGSVEFGQGGQFDKAVSETEAVTIHQLTLTGLEPGERYDYRAKYGDRLLEAASFTTAPPPGTKFWKFAAYGDNRSNPDTHARVVQQLIKAEPEIVLSTGDLVARGKQYELWKREFFDPLAPLSRHTPVYVSLGNHEDHAQNYFDYFTFPNPEQKQYYSFDYANAHIIALDSDVGDLPNPEAFEKEQMDWLKQDLLANQDAQWKIVFFHHPLFNAHPKRDLHALHWQPVLEEYGVDLVFNGHDHYYLRNYAIGNYTGEPKRGVHHMITGGGGAGLYPVVERIHAAFRRSVNHIVAMDVLEDRIIGRAIDIDGNVLDAFVIDKQAVASPEEFIAFEVYQIEEQLKDLIKALPELPADKDIVELKTTFELDNPFTVPISMSVFWSLSNGWSVTPQEFEHSLNPGEKIIIPIHAKGPNKLGAIPPQGKLAFARTDGEKAFRNDELLFFPVKLWSDILYSQMMTSRVSVANKAALMRSITPIPLPITRMDGTVLEYKPIGDTYPDDGLPFESIRLSGKVLGVEFKDELSEKGDVRLRSHDRMEFSFDTATKFEEINLDLRAEKLNEKLCVGEFKLVPRSDVTLQRNEFFAEFDSQIDAAFDAYGWLKITAYAKNGIAGEFEIKSPPDNGHPSILKGKFKLPLELE
jgi:3',5'-cyclic AMP phosphodiesterase CpdA